MARIPSFAALAALVLAAGCVPAVSPAPTIRTSAPPPARVASRSLPEGGATVTVRKGDSLYKISRRYGVALRDLIELNRVRPPYYIFEGQSIRLPLQRVHEVRSGETLYGLARHYGVDMAALVRLNDIPPPYRIRAGTRLRLPHGGVSRVEPVETAAAGARAKAPPEAPPQRVRQPSRVALTRLPPRSGRRFMWPVRGRVIVGFGPRAGGLYNDGINILARKGAAVRAADNGLVAYSGNELRGFGNLLLVKHAGGWMSAYAHNEKLLVRVGDRVKRGQTIARVGATGSVARPQLHFELRRGLHVVNPINHLQPLTADAAPAGLDRLVRPVAFLVGRRDPG